MERFDEHRCVTEEKIANDEATYATEVREGETGPANILILTKLEPEAKGEVNDELEDPMVVEHEGEPFDPLENFSVLALIDVSQKVKKIRKIPAFLHINRPGTIIGSGKRAHFKVDDFESVRTEHGAIVFRDGKFYALPLQGKVDVNGKHASEEGEILENGSRIEMGSATFLFLNVSCK